MRLLPMPGIRVRPFCGVHRCRGYAVAIRRFCATIALLAGFSDGQGVVAFVGHWSFCWCAGAGRGAGAGSYAGAIIEDLHACVAG